MKLKEYIVKVIDQDNETYKMKIFAYSMKGVVDNLVCKSFITHIVNIESKEDSSKWKPTSKIELSDLRKAREVIKDESELMNQINKEEGN